MEICVNLYLTWKCNFFCDHCVHECGPQGNHMTDNQLKRIWDFLHWLKTGGNYKLVMIGLTGGEPTLHPRFWNYIIPEINSIRQEQQLDHCELHSNASIPVPEEEKIKCAKFFSKVIVGHDMFHRKFKSLSKLYLQDYTQISRELILRYNDWYIPGTSIHGSSLRIKGRAAKLMNNNDYEPLLPMAGYPKHECAFYNHGGNCLYVDFTPDHINYYGEKSHPLPGNPDEGQFHSYDISNNDIIHNSLKYNTSYCNVNCSQKCMVAFFREKIKPLIPGPSII